MRGGGALWIFSASEGLRLAGPVLEMAGPSPPPPAGWVCRPSAARERQRKERMKGVGTSEHALGRPASRSLDALPPRSPRTRGFRELQV